MGDELTLPWLARYPVCLENQDIFKTQLRAILRASTVGGNVNSCSHDLWVG